MRIVVDAHVHFYPCYDLEFALSKLAGNLERLAPGAVRAAFLTERSDCFWFNKLKCGQVQIQGTRLDVQATDGEDVIAVVKGGKPQIYLFPGRQVATAERIEILGLTVELPAADGKPATDVVKAVLDAGGVPAIGWSPGKWLFGRKKVVCRLLESFEPGQLVVCDTTLRPTIWPMPRLMKSALRKGFGLVAGSDPLPFAGEEKYMGTYASVLSGEFDFKTPASSVRRLLTDSSGRLKRSGKRCGPLEVLRRLRMNKSAGRPRGRS